MGRKAKLTIAQHMYQDRRNEELDWSRAEGPDPRDPRHQACNHTVQRGNCRVANSHMVKYKCQECDLVLLYVPRHGSSGDYRKATRLQSHSSVAGAHNPEGNKNNPSKLPEEKPTPATKAAPKSKGTKDSNPTAAADKKDKTDKKDAKPTKNKNKGDQHNIGTPKAKNSDDEDPKDEPPTWDGDPGTFKAYTRALKRWTTEQRLLHNIISSSSEEDEEKGEKKTEEKGEKSSTEDTGAGVLSSAGEWELLNEKLGKVEAERKRKEASSEDASMQPSRASSPRGTRGQQRGSSSKA